MATKLTAAPVVICAQGSNLTGLHLKICNKNDSPEYSVRTLLELLTHTPVK